MKKNEQFEAASACFTLKIENRLAQAPAKITNRKLGILKAVQRDPHYSAEYQYACIDQLEREIIINRLALTDVKSFLRDVSSLFYQRRVSSET